MKPLPANSIWIKILPILLLVVLIGVFFYKVLFLGHNFFWRDILSHSYPAKKIFVDAIYAGYYPLWNQFVSTGIPYLADLSNQPLYIFNLLFLLFPANIAINFTVLLHYILGAVFMYLLVYRLIQNKYICIFSALSFALSGYCLSLSCNLEYLTPVIWLPVAIWAFYKSFDTYKTLYLYVCSLSLAMMIFGGEPMAFYFTVGFMFIRTLFELPDKKVFSKYFILMVVIVALSLFFSAIQLLPAIELTHLSTRAAGLTFVEATTWSFNPYRLIEFIIPFFFGHNFPYPQYWGVFLQSGMFSVPWAEAVYIGAIPLVLAFIALILNRIKEKYYWLTMLILSLVLAFGCFTPVYQLCFKFLPFMNSFRYPEKLLLFTTFALCILAGYGLKDIVEHKFYTQGNKILVIPSVLILIAFLTVFLPIETYIKVELFKISGILDASEIAKSIKFGVVYFSIIISTFAIVWYWNKLKNKKATSFIIIVIIMTFVDLFYINSNSFVTTKVNLLAESNTTQRSIKAGWDKKYPPRVYISPTLSDTTPLNLVGLSDLKMLDNFHPIVSAFWQNNLIPNRAIIYKLDTFNTVTSLTLKNITAISRVLIRENVKAFVKLFNINYVIATKKDASKYIAFTERYIESSYNIILQPENVLPRAIISNEQLTNTTIIREIATYDTSNREPNIIEYTNNQVVIDVNMEHGGYLTIFDSFYPGWKVRVNDKHAKLLKIADIYRGVKLNKGKNHIVFFFDPLIIKIGLFITLLSLLIAGILAFKYKTIMKP